MEIGLLILEGVTLAVVVFGALAVFSIRRWFVGTNDATTPWLWLRFTVLLFGFCLVPWMTYPTGIEQFEKAAMG